MSRAWMGLALITLAGCAPGAEPPLVVATDWPIEVRVELQSLAHRSLGEWPKVEWVVVDPGDPMAGVLGRRGGGVDLFLGGPTWQYARLMDSGRLDRLEESETVPWRIVKRPTMTPVGVASATGYSDPRDDPATLALAKLAIDSEGWAKGYEGLVRRASRSRPGPSATSALGPHPSTLGEGIALVHGSKNPEKARRFVRLLGSIGLINAPSSIDQARADGLLADLLGACLVDAHAELRDADTALARYNHPAAAEAALGESPPWPPASVAKLLANPGQAGLVETLAEQLSPDPESRAWLMDSWSRPKRAIDGALLLEIASAVDGRLAREPRFRAWLRGEWTAWTRQLYRRVARVAGGYQPT